MSSAKGPPIDSSQRAVKQRKPLFLRNRSGFGFHPSRWEGWLIIVVIVGLIVTAVVLLKTGVL